MHIAIGTKNKAKIEAVKQVFQTYAQEITYTYVDVESGVRAQPFSTVETRQGAINRAIETSKQTDAEVSFGLEGGVEVIDGVMYCINWGAIALRDGTIFTAAGAAFVLPEVIAEKLQQGQELGPVMDEYTNKLNTRHHEGAIGVFTNGLIDRKEMFAHIVTILVGQMMFTKHSSE